MKSTDPRHRRLNVPEIPVCPTFEMVLEVDKGDVLARLLPLNARLLVHLSLEYARQHRVWKVGGGEIKYKKKTRAKM